MLKTAVDRRSAISIVGEAGLDRLQQHFHGIQFAPLHEGGPEL